MVFGSSGSGFGNPPVGNQGIIQRPVFMSDNYVAGVSGWAIFRNGNVEFNSGTFRGTVTGGAFQGTDFIINPAGIFFYNGTPALGNLVFSVAPVAGTDPYGNVYGTINTVGVSGQVQMQLSDDGFGNGRLNFLISGYNNAGLYGGTNGAYAFEAMYGPSRTAVGHRDYVQLSLFSSDGSSSANAEIVYYDDTGTGHEYLYVDYTGANIQACSVLLATKPGTGTSATNPAQAEGWNGLTCLGTWTLVKGPYYRLMPGGQTVQMFAAATTTAFTGTQQLSVTGALAAGYRPITTWNMGGTGIPGRASAEVTAAGTVIAVAGSATVTECDIAGEYPLTT